jgi:hypothetical protein
MVTITITLLGFGSLISISLKFFQQFFFKAAFHDKFHHVQSALIDFSSPVLFILDLFP